MGTGGSTRCVQSVREFLSGVCDAFPATGSAGPGTPRTDVPNSAQDGRACVKRHEHGSPTFEAIGTGWGVRGRDEADDLRRATTRTAPKGPGHAGVDPGDAGVVPRGRSRRGGVGRRVRVRLDRPGRHGGGGGRGRPALAHTAVLPTESEPHADPHPRTDPDPDSDTQTAARAPATPTAAPRTEARAAASAAACPATGPPAGPEARPRPRPLPRADAVPDAPAQAELASHTVTGALSGVPPPVPPAAAPRRAVAAHVHPAHRRARGVRHRRAAPALIPGGPCCRNGLFSSSRWRPRAPSWSW